MILPVLVLVVMSSAPPVQAAEHTTKDPGLDALALPLVSFNSDLGVTYGVLGNLYVHGDGRVPYQHAVSAQVLFSTRGLHSHFVRYDGPRLLGPLRVEARFDYFRESRSPFYGAGNSSAPDFEGNEGDSHYNYTRGSPGASLRLRGKPLGDSHPLQLYGGYAWRHTNVSPHKASMLAELNPLGIEGGTTSQLLFGVLWDSRDSELEPTTGGIEELSVRASGYSTGSKYQYAGVTLSERRFLRLSSRVVFAQRLTLDMLFGEVPFYEWCTTGGISTPEGVGGMSSVRGIERNRFAGNIKMFSNSELRVRAAEMTAFGHPTRLGAVAFFDVGRVWHPGVTDGAWHRWHPGVGAGLRLSRRAAVVRMDYALSTETGSQRLYLNFGQMF
ncbi:MAG TPA: BamA/TamA family outer membrane protein [Myxococcaceae bacterium]|nr:BamA/TamA family outer membrane protein [Myxococcaceae bacterium]